MSEQKETCVWCGGEIKNSICVECGLLESMFKSVTKHQRKCPNCGSTACITQQFPQENKSTTCLNCGYTEKQDELINQTPKPKSMTSDTDSLKSTNINVLGSTYRLNIGSRAEIKISPDYQGECRCYEKQINIVNEFDSCDCNTKISDLEVENMRRQIITHELAHAFLFESGKVTTSLDEDLVEWLSVNASKLVQTVADVMKTLK